MRRKDKQVNDPHKIEEMIARASVLRIALHDDPFPYLVPVNFGYSDHAFYFHSAPEGKKIDLIRKNNRVCFEIEADFGLVKGDTPCKWSSRYASAIGFGGAYFIEGPEEKRTGLEIIFQHYSCDPFETLTTSLDAIAIIKIEIESMTGKVSGMS